MYVVYDKRKSKKLIIFIFSVRLECPVNRCQSGAHDRPWVVAYIKCVGTKCIKNTTVPHFIRFSILKIVGKGFLENFILQDLN